MISRKARSQNESTSEENHNGSHKRIGKREVFNYLVTLHVFDMYTSNSVWTKTHPEQISPAISADKLIQTKNSRTFYPTPNFWTSIHVCALIFNKQFLMKKNHNQQL